MSIVDNANLYPEALRRIGASPSADPSSLKGSEFDQFLLQMAKLKATAGPYRNLTLCRDCYAVHYCPFGARHENAFDDSRLCGSCGSREGFFDENGRWVSFAHTWKPWTWGRGCWVFEFCTSPGHNTDGTKKAAA